MEKLESQEIIKLLENIIGRTKAVGETNTDNARLNNLKVLIAVTDWCLYEIADSAADHNAAEWSVCQNGEMAYRKLDGYSKWIAEVLGEI